MSFSGLEYPVTRRFEVKYLGLALIVLGSIWTCVVTLIMIVAVGYDTTQVYRDSFNPTSSLWYEKLFPVSGWIPKSTECQGDSISAVQGYCLLSRAVLRVVLSAVFGNDLLHM